ncbi:hypothetical protein PVAP13_8KG010720 [Panicum virgatum]|uniref:Uncharacterized protein n=1 Tax=Panicum virgatum TaxID=38727 RepID=A0A8T0PFS6_PANVG|nr:hypothetical protein PVAP13_8KG010720 [Panicum virgatum]
MDKMFIGLDLEQRSHKSAHRHTTTIKCSDLVLTRWRDAVFWNSSNNSCSCGVLCPGPWITRGDLSASAVYLRLITAQSFLLNSQTRDNQMIDGTLMLWKL